MSLSLGNLRGGRPLAVAVVALLLLAPTSAAEPPVAPCGDPAAGTLPLAAWRLCLLASRAGPDQAEEPGVAAVLLQGSGSTRREQPLPADLGANLSKPADSHSASRRPARDEGGKAALEGLVIDASAEVGGAAALLGEDEKRPTYTLSGRRRWKGTKYQSLGGGQPNATAQRPGVIDVRLSSELQTAQRAAAPVVRHGGLVAALAAVMACVSLVAGVQGSAAHMHILPALAVVLLGVLACGATILLQSRRGRGGLHPRNSQQPMQGSGKFDTPAATFQSLGGSSVPSFGSRPNTALSVGSAAGSPDLSPATDSIMGSTRQVVRFTSAEAEVFASRASPSGLDPSSSRTSHAAGGETSPLMPLCRALVLPSNEAHLQIQLSALSEAARDGGEFYILGPLGNRLLRTEVEKEGAARSLEIFMASASDTLARNARVAAVVAQGPGAPGLLITGPNGQAYGEMVPRRGGGGFAVLCPNRPLPALLLVGDAAGLQLSASSGEDGRHLASTSAGRAPGGGDRLEVRVRAGVDTALVLSCILAAVVFS